MLRKNIRLAKEYLKNRAEAGGIDDEYKEASEPRVLLTTSRKPSQRLLQFVKELKLLFPTSVRINRGAYLLGDLTKICNSHGFTDLIIAHEQNGRPDGLIMSHLPLGPTIYFGLSSVFLRHDASQKLAPVSEALPHIILHGLDRTSVGKRIGKTLQHLFPVARVDSKRVISFVLQEGDDRIAMRHHTFTDKKALKEAGPRFEMRPYQVVLGAVDNSHAQKQWSLRPYMRKQKKIG